MENTVLIPISLDKFQVLVTDVVNSCLKHHKPNNVEQSGLEDELLTPDQAAKFLKVTRNCIDNWRKAGKIPFVRVGGSLVRYRKSDLLGINSKSKKAA